MKDDGFIQANFLGNNGVYDKRFPIVEQGI